MRVLVGMSAGITNTVNMSLIAEIFVDEKKRSKIMGFYNSTLSVIGAIVTAGAGVMAAASGWQSVFKIYWLAVPILVLVILFVPRTPAEGKISPEEASEEVATGNKNWVLIFAALVFGFLVYNIGYATLVYQVGVIVAEGGLGDESFAGTLSSLATITGFVTNFGFGFYYARTKRGTPIIGYALIVIGFCLFYFFGSRMTRYWHDRSRVVLRCHVFLPLPAYHAGSTPVEYPSAWAWSLPPGNRYISFFVLGNFS